MNIEKELMDQVSSDMAKEIYEQIYKVMVDSFKSDAIKHAEKLQKKVSKIRKEFKWN
jgi:hypothetical protein